MREKFNLYCKRKKEKMIRFYHPCDAQKKWIETITTNWNEWLVFFLIFYQAYQSILPYIDCFAYLLYLTLSVFGVDIAKTCLFENGVLQSFHSQYLFMDFPYSLFFFSFPYVLVVRISSKIKQYLLADISL